MELTIYDKNMISAINSNNIEEICKQFCENNFNIDIFKKENIYLFDKNVIYLSYFRGYYWCCFNSIKAKKLMKYNNPFIFLLNHLGGFYYLLNKYNKAIYYLKKNKNEFAEIDAYYLLNIIYDKLNKKIKSIYYRLKSGYIMEKIYYIFFILNKK